MVDIQTCLPKLTVNKLFIQDLMASNPPCFAMGYVEERESISGFITLRPETPIPSTSTQQGFRFGHSVLSFKGTPVLQFVFEFYGHCIYHGLVTIGNPIIQAVISTMLGTEDYFFFAINPDQTVNTFRSKLEYTDLAGLKTSFDKFKDTSCSLEEYERAVKTFSEKPNPPGQVMEWVCRNNWDCLDLTQSRLELNPKS